MTHARPGLTLHMVALRSAKPHILPLLACHHLLHKIFSCQAVHTINYSILLSAKHLGWKYLLLPLLVETGWFEQPSVPTLFVSLMSPFSFHMVASYGLYGETRQNFRIPSVNHILVYLVHQCATSLILRPKQGKCLNSNRCWVVAIQVFGRLLVNLCIKLSFIPRNE